MLKLTIICTFIGIIIGIAINLLFRISIDDERINKKISKQSYEAGIKLNNILFELTKKSTLTFSRINFLANKINLFDNKIRRKVIKLANKGLSNNEIIININESIS